MEMSSSFHQILELFFRISLHRNHQKGSVRFFLVNFFMRLKPVLAPVLANCCCFFLFISAVASVWLSPASALQRLLLAQHQRVVLLFFSTNHIFLITAKTSAANIYYLECARIQKIASEPPDPPFYSGVPECLPPHSAVNMTGLVVGQLGFLGGLIKMPYQ